MEKEAQLKRSLAHRPRRFQKWKLLFSSWFHLFMPFCILMLLKFRSWQSVPLLDSCFSTNLIFGVVCNSNHTGIYTRRIKLHVPGERSLGLRNTVRCVPTAVQSLHPQRQGTSITQVNSEAALYSAWKSSHLQTSRGSFKGYIDINYTLCLSCTWTVYYRHMTSTLDHAYLLSDCWGVTNIIGRKKTILKQKCCH